MRFIPPYKLRNLMTMGMLSGALLSGCAGSSHGSTTPSQGAKPPQKAGPEASFQEVTYRPEAPQQDLSSTQLPGLPEAPSKTVHLGDHTYDIYAMGPEKGEPVMLLKAYPPEPRGYGLTMERLAKRGFRAVVALRRNSKNTEAPIPKTAENSDQVVALADAMHLQLFHVAGSELAWEVAREAPERVISVATIPVLEVIREQQRQRSTHRPHSAHNTHQSHQSSHGAH